MPARLVNTPKVYLYTKDESGAVHNFTSYVVSGQVQRKINQVSTAEVTLRNPYKIFTGGLGNPRAFHPMDPVTIYLERIQGFPVRVFTGYLDTTPYYQMFPGTITIQASCTLKRLLYTWFDPSLPYVIAFFTKYGWINTGQGSIISKQAFDGSALTQADVNAGKLPFTALQDGSLGKLLWAILYDIGEWNDTNIYIESLPTGADGLAARMAALMTSLQKDEAQAASDFSLFLSSVIGASAQGSGGGPGANTAGGGKVSSSLLNANQRAFGSALSQITGLDPNVVAAWLLSEEPASSAQAPNGANNWLNVGSTNSAFLGGNNSIWGDPRTAGNFTGQWMQGQSPDPGFGTASAGIQAIPKTAGQSPQAQIQAIQGSGWATSGYPTLPGVYQSVLSAVGVSKPTTSSASTSTQSGHTAPANKNAPSLAFPLLKGTFVGQSSWSQDQGVDISTTGGGCGSKAPEVAIASGTVIGHGIQGFGPSAPILKLDTPISGQNYVYYGHAGPTGLAAIGTHLNAGDQIASVGCGIVGISMGPHLEIGFCDQNGSPVPNTSSQMMSTLQTATVIKTPGGGGTPGSTAGGATGNASSAGTAQAFVAELQFPSVEEQVTAIALGAEHKGLMHDQSLMPFVQQVAQASMRSFQSLPNGDFYAFYPDYFGEMGHHDPYWFIRDIEILDGGISLSDDALATHVFAVGDNTWPINQELLNMLFSAGTVNIFNAFIGTGIIDPTSTSKPSKESKGLAPGIMKADEAVKFIQRYGARPLVQNYPMVRSPIFEMLLAYQQFMLAWSNQFKTPFKFTFMPELFPGGKVGFPDHGLQMYINSVTHSWNYEEGGFTTDAELSAPSLLSVHGKEIDPADFPDLPPNMVAALIEPLRPTAPQPATAKQQVQNAVSAVEQTGVQVLQGLKGLF